MAKEIITEAREGESDMTEEKDGFFVDLKSELCTRDENAAGNRNGISAFSHSRGKEYYSFADVGR